MAYELHLGHRVRKLMLQCFDFLLLCCAGEDLISLLADKSYSSTNEDASLT